MKLPPRLIMCLIIPAILVTQATPARAGVEGKVEQLGKKVKTEIPYELGSEIELELTMGEAVRLICKKNPYGLNEILICPEGGWLYQYLLWNSGNISGGGRNLQEREFFRSYNSDTKKDPTGKWKFPLLFRGRARIPIAVREKWHVVDKKVLLKYEIVTDPDEIQSKMSAQNKTASGFTKLKKTVDRMRKKTGVDMSCKSGEVMEFVVPAGRSARLDCSELGIGLTDVLFWPKGKQLHMCCVWADGHFSYNPKPLKKKQTLWVPSPPRIALDLKWKKVPKGLRVEVIAETNEDEIAKIMHRFLKKAGGNKTSKPIGSQERLAGFVRLWCEVKYNFAFFDQIPNLDWDKVLDEYLPKVQQDQSLEEYYRLLQGCLARLNDGHTSAWPPAAHRAFIAGLLIRPIDGKAIVVDVHKTKKIARSGISPGAEITHVDGRPVAEVLRQDIYPYTCASTPQGRDRDAYLLLLSGPMGTQVRIRAISSTGKTSETTLARLYPANSTSFPKPPFKYRELPDGIAYVALNSFSDIEVVNEFDKVFEKISKANGLIIDVRENGGGNSSFADAIAGYLTDKPLTNIHWKTRRYIPAFRAWGREETWHEGDHKPVQPVPNAKPFLGPVVVLIGAGTVSAAEDFLIPLHFSGRVTLVGQRTAGTTGQPLIVKLPGGGGARICTKRDTYPDGRDFVGVGVIPDVEVSPNRDDIAAGRDVVLDKALEVIKQRIGK